jgi:hypothetical protein
MCMEWDIFLVHVWGTFIGDIGACLEHFLMRLCHMFEVHALDVVVHDWGMCLWVLVYDLRHILDTWHMVCCMIYAWGISWVIWHMFEVYALDVVVHAWGMYWWCWYMLRNILVMSWYIRDISWLSWYLVWYMSWWCYRMIEELHWWYPIVYGGIWRRHIIWYIVDTLYGTGFGAWLMYMVWYKLWYMVDMHGWCMVWYRLMCMVWYRLWYMVYAHDIVMVLVYMWVDPIIVDWWWYINEKNNDGDSESDNEKNNDRLHDWLIISHRLLWKW